MAMKWIAVSVKDLRAETFGTPYFVPNEAVALRTFVNEVNRMDEKNPLFTNPEDFELHYCGTFDDQTALFEPLFDPEADRVVITRLVAAAKEVKRVVN